MADYINGKELFVEMVEYKNTYNEAIANGKEAPPLTRKICDAIIQINNRLASSFKFTNYPFKEDLISDGIFKCMRKVHLFDPERTENVFAYLTQIAYNQFLLRIKTEQYQMSVKAKMIRTKLSSEFVAHGVDADIDDGSNSFVEFLKEHDSYVDYIEQRDIEEKKEAESPSKYVKHRNKTPYKKKKETVSEEVIDIELFE